MRIIILISLLCLFAPIQTADVTITCGADTTCTEGYSLTYTSGSINESACSSKCTAGTSMTIQTYSCTSDVYGYQCPSQICWYADTFTQCINETNACDPNLQYSYNIECKNCIDKTSCINKCVFVDGQEMCPTGNLSTCGFTKVEVDVADCTQNSWGFECACCGTSVTSGFTNTSGICISTDEQWYNQIIKNLWSDREFSQLAFFVVIAFFGCLSNF